MACRRAHGSGFSTHATRRADIDGLATVATMSVAMADRLQCEDAATLLRRALALLRDAGRDTDAAAAEGFIRS